MPDAPVALRAQLEMFIESLHVKLAFHEASMEMVDRKLATRFNILELLPPNEPGVSRVLRELLDPKGKHGQGASFLLLFLDMLGFPKPRTPGNTVVIAEHYTRHGAAKGRWIDLLIRYDGYAIGLENKLDARDQHNQVRDYLEDVKRQGRDGAWLVYLTPDGRDPSQWSLGTASDALIDDSLRLLAYTTPKTGTSTIVNWLNECRRACESEKIREFLSDFQGYIRLRFP